MGVDLHDNETDEVVFEINFWHYRAIIEAIRRLGILPDEKVDSLHEAWCGNGLSITEARMIAAKLKEQLLPTTATTVRILLDGRRTGEPDDGAFHLGADVDLNYGTTPEVLLKFITCCETCNGFTVY